MDKKVLLIADDDEMNRMIIRKFLQDDYEMIEAADGKQTMEILHSRHVDIMLLDIIMPHLDGLEVLKEMKKEKDLSHVGVLVATSTKEKTEREALSLAADDIVAKPYDPVVIKKRMENILAMKTLMAQQNELNQNHTQGFYDIKNRETYAKMQAGLKKIVKYADIIRANKSNYKLVDEIVEGIKTEAELVMDIPEK